MEKTPGVVDVDWYVEDDQPKYRLLIDREKAALSGIREPDILRTLALATSGEQQGLLHDAAEREAVPLVLRVDRATRSDLARLQDLRLTASDGTPVSVSELVRAELVTEDKSIHHKNLMRVVYVTADVAGELESPVYAILKLGP